MITQQLIDEWTRNAPAAGAERDLIIAQRAAQLAQLAQDGADRGLRWKIACKVAGWASVARLGDNSQGVAAEILFLVAGWVCYRGQDFVADLLQEEASRK